jgi:competence protein ComEC
VLNVGQGDALYIESPTGTTVLVDGGPNKALVSELPHVLPWYDRHIDMIVVGNADQDHYSGFIPLLQQYTVDTVLESGTPGASPSYAVLEREITDKKIPKIIARRGQTIDLGGGAYLQVLFPDRDSSLMDTNNASVVMRLVYGDTSVALQSDSTSQIEEYLLARDAEVGGETLKSTILKAGHHGSKTSSSPQYVSAVDPQWAVMSTGVANTYGLPDQETLDTFAKDHIPALDTCVMGRIIFHSDGKHFTLENKNILHVTAGCKS